jgi:dUTP pyrophosphatase
LCNRSSNPLKNFLLLGNGVGIIDSDYYNNENNEGHIMFQFINFGLKDLTIKKGERIGQGIFLPFLKADGDESEKTRTGGFGSSGK